MKLDDSVSTIPSIGPFLTKRLKKLNILTVKDLVYHFPHRYQDYSLVSPIEKVQPGEVVTIQGQILKIENIYTRSGKKIQKAVLSDGESTIDVTWFNQPYLVKSLPVGSEVSLSGKVGLYGRKKVLVSPQYERLVEKSLELSKNTIHTGRLVGIYPETFGLSSKWIRGKLAVLLPIVTDQVGDILPEKIKEKYKLMALERAIESIHFPHDLQEAEKARRRLGFDEFFEIQLQGLSRRKKWQERKVAHKLKLDREKILLFLKNLPFELTGAQKKASREILEDLKKDKSMNRLLEGDVGSGKTVVAAMAAYVAFFNHYQSAIMAPTQILAFQHYMTLQGILGPLGVNVGLLTSEKGKSKKERESKYDVIVGTHSLIQKGVNFEKLALVVIDEQHRFGVAQRANLAKKGKNRSPHILTMTATPIPRTVALVVYGDLDLSVLDEMPKGRKIVKTWVVPPKKREAAYKWIRERVKNTDEQAFIVCPLIEESQFETMQTVKAATVEFERLKKKVFPDLRLGLLHGKIKAKEKDEIMEKMKKGRLDILVATPVVEVGIDLTDATIMMIEAAERFGLAGLHQLRGRVGRGDKQSYCLLFTQNRSPKVWTRLKALVDNLSGPELAELDLTLRGPGDVFGTLQHGFPELKIANFGDFELIKQAREAAEEVFENLDDYPDIENFLLEKSQVIASN